VAEEATQTETETKKPAGEELEGEGQERLVGIMYSERQWVVPEAWKVIFLFGAVAMIVGLVAFSVDKRLDLRRLQLDSVVEPTPMRNVAAPDFVLPKGETNEGIRLSQYKGKWVFVNFWATWCPPCRDEMPSMEMLNRRFKDKDFVMLAISVDEDWGEVNRFFGETAPSFEVVWDKRKTASRMYGTSKFPESYLIAPDGTVAAKFVGPRDWYNVGTVEYFEGVLAGKRDPA
jgi:thiol-disulfide isomerase/thioredoxin